MLFSLTSPRLFSAVSRKPSSSFSPSPPSPSSRTQWTQLSPGKSISLRRRVFLLPAKATTEQSGLDLATLVSISNTPPQFSVYKAIWIRICSQLGFQSLSLLKFRIYYFNSTSLALKIYVFKSLTCSIQTRILLKFNSLKGLIDSMAITLVQYICLYWTLLTIQWLTLY